MEPSHLQRLDHCPICSGTDLVLATSVVDHSFSQEVFNLVDCSSCGFRFTDPRPAPEHIGRYYGATDYISHTNTSTTLNDRLYQLARGRALKSKHRLLAQFHPSGTVLDIGCGTGEFLGYLKQRGYAVRGVEPDPKARAQATVNHGLSVASAVGELGPSERSDAITLWHVLEHLHDLHEVFGRFEKNLLPGGHLMIAVPDRESWDAHHYGPLWAAWDVPRHLSHFRSRDIARLLSEHRFELVLTKRMWFDAPYVSMLSERYRGRGRFMALVVGILIGAWSNLIALVAGRPSSSTLFIAKKR